ncbi:MAG TPA: MFS transporter [Terriglobales bacterium]|nr:MFS transporter [Terriglobales bacterium]
MKALRYFSRQEKPFKVNMLKAAGSYFLRTLTLQYQSIYIAALGASALQVGIANGIGGVSATAIALPIGWLADKYGVRRIFLTATSLMLIGAILFASAKGWMIVILALLLGNLGLQMENTACPIVCGSCLKNDERATGMGLCDTLTAVPGLVSPLVGALVITGFGGLNVAGIKPLYYLQIVGFSLLLLFVLKEFTEPSRRCSQIEINLKGSIRELFQRGTRLKSWILFVSLSTIPLYMATMVYVPLYAAEMKHADAFVLGLMAMASMIMPLVLSIPLGRLADRIGRKKVLALTVSIYCLSLVLLLYAADSTALIMSGILQGFLTLTAVIRTSMTEELVPTALLGRIFGILGVFMGIAMILSPILGGILWSVTGPSSIFYLMLALQVLSIFVLFTMPETLIKKADLDS